MELTDRERRILEELERQFADEQSTAASPAVCSMDQQAAHRGVAAQPRARRASVPAAALGLLLIAVGIPLGVTSSVLLGLLFVGWFLPHRLRRSLKQAGRFLLKAVADAVRQVPPGGSIPW